MENEYNIPPHVSRRKASELLKCSLTTLDALIESGELNHYRTGSFRNSRVLVSVHSIERFINKGSVFYKTHLSENENLENFLGGEGM